jgi:protein-tyrosine phosphatase
VTANLLVVCTANIARSPLAAALLQVHVRARGLEDQVKIASAGTRAREGYAAAQPSVAIAAGWGVDLRRHRSQPVTDELLEGSDLIVTMTEVHRVALDGRGDGVSERCFTLHELRRLLHGVDLASSPQASSQASPQLSPDQGPDRPTLAISERVAVAGRQAHQRRPVSVRSGREDIPDPYGRDEEVYQAVATELVEVVGAIATPLLGPVPAAAHVNLPRAPRASRPRRLRRRRG